MPPDRTAAKDWLRKAHSDLESARKLISLAIFVSSLLIGCTEWMQSPIQVHATVQYSGSLTGTHQLYMYVSTNSTPPQQGWQSEWLKSNQDFPAAIQRGWKLDGGHTYYVHVYWDVSGSCCGPGAGDPYGIASFVWHRYAKSNASVSIDLR